MSEKDAPKSRFTHWIWDCFWQGCIHLVAYTIPVWFEFSRFLLLHQHCYVVGIFWVSRWIKMPTRNLALVFLIMVSAGFAGRAPFVMQKSRPKLCQILHQQLITFKVGGRDSALTLTYIMESNSVHWDALNLSPDIEDNCWGLPLFVKPGCATAALRIAPQHPIRLGAATTAREILKLFTFYGKH